jgi:hypothetical protein
VHACRACTPASSARPRTVLARLQVRLLTDVFQVLIPGINVDYPHRGLALSVATTEEPVVTFVAGEGMRFSGAYETRVWVLPEAPAAPHGDSCAQEGAVEVAVLRATVSGVAEVQYERTLVPHLDVRYRVVSGPYADRIKPESWESTIKYVVDQLQRQLSIHAVYQALVAPDVASRVHVADSSGTYLDGWYKLSVDFQVDTDP